jgi:hypothetical protein
LKTYTLRVGDITGVMRVGQRKKGVFVRLTFGVQMLFKYFPN